METIAVSFSIRNSQFSPYLRIGVKQLPLSGNLRAMEADR
jgi:hypothetical protein